MRPNLQKHTIKTPHKTSNSLRPQQFHNAIPIITVQQPLAILIFRLVTVTGNHMIEWRHQEA